MIRKVLFIVNPVAGGGKTLGVLPLIEKRMKENSINYKIIMTQGPRDATKIAEENVEKFTTIVAVGGDGTVNEVAKGLINKRMGTLAILPCGTGNDFGRVVGIPNEPEKAIDVLLHNNVKTIDIGKINGYSFLNIASFGFDTEVVIQTNKIKKRIKNQFSYLLGVLATLVYYKRRQRGIIIDGVEYNRNLVLLAVGNGRFYGGGLEILPMAKMDDENLHICLIKDLSNLKILALFPSIFKAQHIKYKKYVEIYKAKKVILKNNENININIDGEIVPIEGNIIFEIDNFKLNVIFS
ncbi:diacylglycerol kinase family protein [Tissierella sp. Yu-01]|uniref:diacylglycerol/lipid kinase family protein n=1 Tax=Tissierella sp. Yu-01 TaxID=3035694 RepID=UPI00240E2319|nr:diacylglycerol kinase family protein [Tissierella sp. Yu-01]WFA08301.1 diacylglycerol kinase family lipid kinase [Tissierella sp. Yu-01]